MRFTCAFAAPNLAKETGTNPLVFLRNQSWKLLLTPRRRGSTTSRPVTSSSLLLGLHLTLQNQM